MRENEKNEIRDHKCHKAVSSPLPPTSLVLSLRPSLGKMGETGNIATALIQAVKTYKTKWDTLFTSKILYTLENYTIF